MSFVSNILVPVVLGTHSERTLVYAAELARGLNAALEVLRVRPEEHSARRILERTAQGKFGLIVMGTSSPPGGEGFEERVVQRVVGAAPCPVLLVGSAGSSSRPHAAQTGASQELSRQTLARYTESSWVSLGPDASAYDAARAMSRKHVATVIVQDEVAVLGVVTDREIAIRVTGQGLDPRRVALKWIMNRRPVMLSIDATEQEALACMREQAARSVVLLENDRAVGVVTLDDLLLAEGADAHALADVVRAQLDARRHQSRGKPYSGLIASRHRAVGLVQEATGLGELEALTALEVVVRGIVRRLALKEASDLMAQLPSELRERLLQTPSGHRRGLARESLESELTRRLQVSASRAAQISRAVGAALRTLVGGEREQSELARLLPEEVQSPAP